MSEIITLDMSTPAVQYLCKKDKRLAKVINMVGPITYVTHAEDPYAFLIHEIIEQMLSVKAGTKIYNRLIELCGGSLTPDSINLLSIAQIRETGTSSTKASYIKGITEAVLSEELKFDELESMTDEAVTNKLLALRGIGSWTAKMYLIFVLNRPDILPYEDVAFLQSYEWIYKTKDRSKESIEKRCRKWKPYSSIAARYMYKALDNGLTKEVFHLYK